MSIKTLPCDNSIAEEGRFKSPFDRSNSVRMPRLPKTLTGDEKKYLLAVDRGDLALVRRLVQNAQQKPDGSMDINCQDPLGRGALLMAIEASNLAMVELLVVLGVKTADSLLHAIDKEFVEAVELLLDHEELTHKEGEPYSWESVDRDTATFTPEITPLILASHRNNYEILKLLLDRGATIPMPHDIRCGCGECVEGVREDSLRHSASRINSYKALSSPSLIALTSTDPLLTSITLSWELKQLSVSENEFRSEYLELRKRSQEFAVSLLDKVRTTHELKVMLNYDPHIMRDENALMEGVDEDGVADNHECGLARLRMAINYKQKKFVAHPSIQQLLAAMWYDGLPGFRKKTTIGKGVEIARIIVTFPLYCMWYMLLPKSRIAKGLRKPFMKFLIHAASYLFFLLLLILVSQRVETLVLDYIHELTHGPPIVSSGSGDEDFVVKKRQRGNPPQYLELFVMVYVLGFIVEESRELFKDGLRTYVSNLWNAIDFLRNALYCAVVLFRTWAYLQQKQEIAVDPEKAFIPREEWDDFDPQLVAEGLFAAANIFSALKLVHLSTINPHLGPLQISLGRMVYDILKFFFFYTLVLFAFACGLNQLLWYFADLEKQKCYSLPGGLPDWNKAAESCLKWRRFGNLFESSQSLFWASFGMVGLADFELTGIKSYSRFWALLMFGSYCVINVIVLLNLLIAMLSNTYAEIAERADVEWKFARTKLWLSYFEEDGTLPSPFNLVPTPKQVKRSLTRFIPSLAKIGTSLKHREARVAELKEQARQYTAVMRALVWRYVSGLQRKSEENDVTEDDINEVKGEISTLRCDLIEVFRRNGMNVNSITDKPAATGRKTRDWERKLLRGFHVTPAAGDEAMDLMDDPEHSGKNQESEEGAADRFRRMARLALLNRERIVRPPNHLSHIGRANSSESFKSRQSLKKAMDEARLQIHGAPKSPGSKTTKNNENPKTGNGETSMTTEKEGKSKTNVGEKSAASGKLTMKSLAGKIGSKDESQPQTLPNSLDSMIDPVPTPASAPAPVVPPRIATPTTSSASSSTSAPTSSTLTPSQAEQPPSTSKDNEQVKKLEDILNPMNPLPVETKTAKQHEEPPTTISMERETPAVQVPKSSSSTSSASSSSLSTSTASTPAAPGTSGSQGAGNASLKPIPSVAVEPSSAATKPSTSTSASSSPSSPSTSTLTPEAANKGSLSPVLPSLENVKTIKKSKPGNWI